MATIKSFTDIGQSKKLAEILPIKSADMLYKQILPKSDRISHVPVIGNPLESLEWFNKGYTYAGKKALSIEEYCIPCWSLAALLEQLDDEIVDEYGNDYNLNIVKEGLKYQLYYQDSWRQEKDIETDYYDDMIDACYEMIMKLKEKNLL